MRQPVEAKVQIDGEGWAIHIYFNMKLNAGYFMYVSLIFFSNDPRGSVVFSKKKMWCILLILVTTPISPDLLIFPKGC
jgi:hypothetical protein